MDAIRSEQGVIVAGTLLVDDDDDSKKQQNGNDTNSQRHHSRPDDDLRPSVVTRQQVANLVLDQEPSERFILHSTQKRVPFAGHVRALMTKGTKKPVLMSRLEQEQRKQQQPPQTQQQQDDHNQDRQRKRPAIQAPSSPAKSCVSSVGGYVTADEFDDGDDDEQDENNNNDQDGNKEPPQTDLSPEDELLKILAKHHQQDSMMETNDLEEKNNAQQQQQQQQQQQPSDDQEEDIKDHDTDTDVKAQGRLPTRRKARQQHGAFSAAPGAEIRRNHTMDYQQLTSRNASSCDNSDPTKAVATTMDHPNGAKDMETNEDEKSNARDPMQQQPHQQFEKEPWQPPANPSSAHAQRPDDGEMVAKSTKKGEKTNVTDLTEQGLLQAVPIELNEEDMAQSMGDSSRRRFQERQQALEERHKSWTRTFVVTGILLAFIVIGAALGLYFAVRPTAAVVPTTNATDSNITKGVPVATESPQPFHIVVLPTNMSGSAEPSSSTEEALLVLSQATWTTIQNDPTSPQALAYDWLVEEGTTYPLPRRQQRFALATLYHATGGSQWTNADGWLDHTVHECAWHSKLGYDVDLFQNQTAYVETWLQVQKDWLLDDIQSFERFFSQLNDTGTDVWSCNEQQEEYTMLKLYKNNLRGKLPPEISMLTLLHTIEIASNPALYGTIPSEISMLQELQYLILYENAISGTLPSTIGLLSNLKFLSIYGQEDLPQVSGPIPSELAVLTDLFFVNLEGNSLTGSLPTQLGQLTKMRYWASGYNSMNATLPSEIGLWTNCNYANFPASGFFGTIPKEWYRMSSLVMLALWGNELEGPISDQLARLYNLQYLNMKFNRFSGTVPATLGYLSKLYLLSYGGNAMTGSIPAEVAQMTDMVQFYFYNNSLTGGLPVEMMQSMSKLEILAVEHNRFNTGVPSELGLLSNLVVARLSGGGWTGALPIELSNWNSLQYLDLSSNPLVGTVPLSLVDGWQDLQYLDISNTSIEGVMPPRLCGLPYLTHDCSADLCGCDCNCTFA